MPTLKLIPNRCNVPVISLRISGQDYHFLIDTGASHSVLRETLLTAKCPTRTVSHMTHNGRVFSTEALYKFRFAGALLSTIEIHDISYLDDLIPNLGGIIGQDILKQFKLVMFDWRLNILQLEL